jgi:hypothetical protein
MIDRDELELRLATTLAPMLLTIATFSLTVMGLQQNPEKTIVDELFSFIGAACLLAAAVVADSALDKQDLGLFERMKFMGGGYLFFCLVVGAMSTAIPILYSAKRAGGDGITWHKSYLWFISVGIFVVLKLMSHKDKQVWTAAIILSYFASLYALW